MPYYTTEGKRIPTKKVKSCIRKLKRRGIVRSPYAVCYKTLGVKRVKVSGYKAKGKRPTKSYKRKKARRR